jgi:hypothetical protein
MPPSSPHPSYRGPVIDAHAHFDAASRSHAHAVLGGEGMADAVINFWDASWPPPSYRGWHETWQAELACGISLLHMPDLSRVGAPGFERELADGIRDAKRLGALGIKVWKNLGLTLRDADGHRLAVDDPRLGALWHLAGELGLPVAIHVADAVEFFEPAITPGNERYDELQIHPEYWFGDRTRFASREQIFEEFECVVAEHPDTTFVALHFGCFMALADVRRMLACYPNYLIDTAARTFDLGRAAYRDEALRVFAEWPERVIFGTDLVRTDGYDLPDRNGPRGDLRALYEHHWRLFETTDDDIVAPYEFQPDHKLTGFGLDQGTLRLLYHDNADRVYCASQLRSGGQSR